MPALTGLRILAAVLVVMFHFLYVRVAPGQGLPHAATLVVAHVVSSGFTGVGFFFILSGFILAYSYLRPDGRLRGTRAHFWWARISRIYPIYIVALLLDVLAYTGWGTATPPAYQNPRFLPTVALSPLLLQAWLPFPPSWNPPTWSLSAEAFFYALFPLLVPAVARLRRRHLPVAALAFWGLAVAVVVAYVLVDPDKGQRVPWYDRHWLRILYQNPLTRLPEFFLGAVVGRLYVTRAAADAGASGASTARAATGARRLLDPAPLSAAALMGIAVVWCLGPWPVTLVNQVVLDPLYALLVYAAAFGRGPVAALFGLRAVVALGEASYALYLLQWPVHDWLTHLGVASAVARLAPPAIHDQAFFALFLCVAVATALLAYRVVERPAQRALRRLADARRPANAESEGGGGEDTTQARGSDARRTAR